MNDMLNPENCGPFGKDIPEPYLPWYDDGGKRVVLVTDPNWLIDGKPRVIRRVGWRSCMTCGRRIFSEDISKIRMCDGCKTSVTDKSSYG